MLIAEQASFGFETVMSHPSKIEFLAKARKHGYKVYLYFVCTGDPVINVERVKQRVREGGHDVPTDKITTRYWRSLELLSEAVQGTDRAYLFDSSGSGLRLVASVTGGKHIELTEDSVPKWVDNFLLSKAKPVE
jgi:predicted ABC-type ATPase